MRRAFTPWSTSILLRCAGDTGTMSVRTCSARIRISGIFRKFKKTFPVMMQFESVLLKGREFPRRAMP